MNPSLIQWAIGALGATVVMIITATVVLLRVAFKLGEVSYEVASAAKKLSKIETSIEVVPIHETKIQMLQSEVTSLRRKVYGLPSRPDYNSDGEE